MSTSLALVGGQGALATPQMDVFELGEVFAKSGYFEDARDPAKAIVKILAGRELGITPFTAMNAIHIIKGKPTVSANLMAQALKASPKYDFKVIQLEDDICELEFFEGGQPVGRSTFTEDDARKAGTQNMSKFPRNMLFARAVSNGVRFYAPDVFTSVVYTPEEMGAAVDAEGNVLEVPQSPPAPSPEADPKRIKAQRVRELAAKGLIPSGTFEGQEPKDVPSDVLQRILENPKMQEAGSVFAPVIKRVREVLDERMAGTAPEVVPAEEVEGEVVEAPEASAEVAKPRTVTQVIEDRRADSADDDLRGIETFEQGDDFEAASQTQTPIHVQNIVQAAYEADLDTIGILENPAALKAINGCLERKKRKPIDRLSDISPTQSALVLPEIVDGTVHW